jgi:hypothetical protein
MKQKMLLAGGTILFLLSTAMLVMFPMHIQSLTAEQWVFLICMAAIGYLGSFMYFSYWVEIIKKNK